MTPAPARELGLSLSGGGYRAAAFHLGTLRQLHAMKVLHKVDVLSTISGGSITGAYWCTAGLEFEDFDRSLYALLQTRNIIRGVLLSWTFFGLVLFALLFLIPAIALLFTPYAWAAPLIIALFVLLLFKFQFQLFPVSRRIEKLYDRYYYKQKTLSQLAPHPELVIGSTNLSTARPFVFSATFMGDSTYTFMNPPIRFRGAGFPVARAVMASSCVPFAFTPVAIDKRYFENPADADRVTPTLVDGGVYDNQGIHKITWEGRFGCRTIITSDAGGGDQPPLRYRNTIALLIRTVDVFMDRIKKGQMIRDLYDNVATADRPIAYLSLGWDLDRCIPGFVDNLASKKIPTSVIEAHQIPAEWVADPNRFRGELIAYLESRTHYAGIDKPTPEEVRIARLVGTNLTALSRRQVDSLIKQARALTELQVKLYCPHLT